MVPSKMTRMSRPGPCPSLQSPLFRDQQVLTIGLDGLFESDHCHEVLIDLLLEQPEVLDHMIQQQEVVRFLITTKLQGLIMAQPFCLPFVEGRGPAQAPARRS